MLLSLVQIRADALKLKKKIINRGFYWSYGPPVIPNDVDCFSRSMDD